MVDIQTERLIIRNYKESDLVDIMNYFSNEEVSKYEDFYPMSEAQVRDIIAEWKEMDNRLVAEVKATNTVIGSIGYWTDDEGHHCIDYDFNPEYSGKGYATEAAKELVRYLFKEVGVPAVYGDCDVRNEASWKLMERLGFRRMEQLDNQSYKDDENGEPILISTYLYGLERSVMLQHLPQ